MGLKNVSGVTDSDRNDRAFCLGCNFETSFMEWEQVQFTFISVSGTLREDTDGNAGFYFIYCCENSLKSLLDIFPVKKETVEITHTCGKKWDFFHFFFGNIACANRTSGVC